VEQILRMCSILLLIMLIGTLFFMLTEGLSVGDAIYLAITTITTVGYGDLVPVTPMGRLTSIVMMVAGVGTALYIFSAIMAFLVEGRLKEAMGVRKMKKNIAKIKRHYIICGYGTLGQMVARDLDKARVDFVFVESNLDKAAEARENGHNCVVGDATHQDILIEAGLERCAGLATTISDDAENLYIGITIRAINPKLPIVCRASSDRVRSLFRRAGISRTISTDEIGSRRLVSSLIRPHVVEFMDELLGHKEGAISVHAIQVESGAPLEGQTIQGAQLKDQHQLVVMTIQRHGEWVLNPGPKEKIQAEDMLIFLGTDERVEALAELVQNQETAAITDQIS
jgi:voltage-gated potassium channel